MPDPLAQIHEISRRALDELQNVDSTDALEQFRIRYLGAKGEIKNLTTLIAQAEKEQKREIGLRVNAARDEVTTAFEQRKADLSSGAGERIVEDITEPGRRPQIGNRHILMTVADELSELFGRMGFAVASGPELEDEFHNFIALNIPPSHPARDPLDNYYVTVEPPLQPCPGVPGEGESARAPREGESARARREGENALLLRTQTSTVQIRVMEKQKPPIRVVIPGRVYRPDTHDETHLSMFHQLEALVIDEGVTMVDLKSTIMQFVHAYFGAETRVRFRPSFFPFTEPSAEVDVYFEDKQRWVELGGCGMVHPNVLKSCKIDPEKYTGWAFGFGIERIAMRKYGITDIRSFVENDVRFLKQF
jgi:phenylalanyl-tRNA synthetase alpha chain